MTKTELIQKNMNIFYREKTMEKALLKKLASAHFLL